MLNHVEGGPAATRVYDRYNYDAEKRDALDRWARGLAAIIEGKTKKVVAFHFWRAPRVDRRGSLRWFSEITVSLPPIGEQTAIAAILSDMDAETAALQAKLVKAGNIKQGMMQELLTGKIRLV